MENHWSFVLVHLSSYCHTSTLFSSHDILLVVCRWDRIAHCFETSLQNRSNSNRCLRSLCLWISIVDYRSVHFTFQSWLLFASTVRRNNKRDREWVKCSCFQLLVYLWQSSHLGIWYSICFTNSRKILCFYFHDDFDLCGLFSKGNIYLFILSVHTIARHGKSSDPSARIR